MNKVKVDLLENLTSDEIEFLKILSYRLNTQDQRCTSYPVWKVCDIERKFGVEDSISDGYCIVNVETEEVYYTCEDIINKIINEETEKLNVNFENINEIIKEYGKEGEVDLYSLKSIFGFMIKTLGWSHYLYCGYIENIKVHANFITENEAEAFLSSNKYKYSEEAYIYVDSAYGNLEFMMLTDILKKLKS